MLLSLPSLPHAPRPVSFRLFAHVHDSRDIRFAHPGLEKEMQRWKPKKVYITEFHYFLAKKQNVYFNQQDWSSKTKVGLLNLRMFYDTMTRDHSCQEPTPQGPNYPKFIWIWVLWVKTLAPSEPQNSW